MKMVDHNHFICHFFIVVFRCFLTYTTSGKSLTIA